MIYTGYFDHITKYLSSGLEVIGITRFPPKELQKYGLSNIAFLSPSSSLLSDYKSGQISKEEFTAAYLDYLTRNEPLVSDIVSWIMQNKKDTVLCCFEKPNEFCHRHILADFITNHYTEVKEYK